jgi:hypothetical protein
MRTEWLTILFVLALLLTGCAPKVIEKVIVRDSTVTKIEERLVHDTVSFGIPVEVEKIVTKDTSSHLENTYAVSDAIVSGGFLTHTLRTIPQVISVPVEIPVVDTTTSHIQIKEVPVEVEKELTWWQNFRLKAFWWLAGGLLAALLWIFRKFIFKI